VFSVALFFAPPLPLYPHNSDQSWLANKTKEQAAKAAHEEPAFRLSDIPGRVDIVDNASARAPFICWRSFVAPSHCLPQSKR
jgi:hypothetical protein